VFEGKHGAINLKARQRTGLPGLGDDELREALLLLDERGGHVLENLAALQRGRGGGGAGWPRRVDGLARVGAVAMVTRPTRPGPRRADLEPFALRSIPCQSRKPV